eukprot:5262867-Amphidinium_carterae.1
MLRNGAQDIVNRPIEIITPSTQHVTMPSALHVVAKTEQRPGLNVLLLACCAVQSLCHHRHGATD